MRLKLGKVFLRPSALFTLRHITPHKWITVDIKPMNAPIWKGLGRFNSRRGPRPFCDICQAKTVTKASHRKLQRTVQRNSTPVLFNFRHTSRDRRIEWPVSNVKSKVSGRPLVFGTSRPAPLLVKSRATQSITEDFPSNIFAPLSTRVRVSLRRSCI
jgi:hypothetical protein